LTRSSIKYVTREKPEEMLASRLKMALVDILVLAGYSRQDILNCKDLNLESRLQRIPELAIQFDKATGEGIMSMDLAPKIIRPGREFKEAKMEDAFEGSRGSKRQSQSQPRKRVFATTGLGLYCVEARSQSGRASATDHHIKILLKPKVMADVESSPLFAQTAC
jgi:hypothetical protein